MENNAEAGPSRQRTGPTPPITPTTSVKAKRRSWFGLPSPVTPLSKEKARERSRNSIAGMEELELGPVTSSSSLRDVKGSSSLVHAVQRQPRPSLQSEEDELITIDGDVEKTVKKKKRRSRGPEDSQEAMRMEDMSRKHQPRTVSDKTVTTDDLQRTPHIIPLRTVSLTKSDHDPFAGYSLPPPPPVSFNMDGDTDPPPPLLFPKPRSSSLRSTPSPTVPLVPLYMDKSQPPLPRDVDRPLPRLPPPERGPARSLEVPTPTEVKITPSSPRKSSKSSISKSAQGGSRRSRSASGHRSGPRRAASVEPSSTLGLGLPSVFTGISARSSRSQSSSRSPSVSVQSPSPPPLPSKAQSVSTPLPSRPASPNPRITFANPEVSVAEKPKMMDGDKRPRVKRARSLSGLFSKPAPSQAVPTPDLPRQSDSQSEATEPEDSGGRLGVLEWLGVRKTVKRKPSEGKLREGRPDHGISLNEMPQRRDSGLTDTSSGQGPDIPTPPAIPVGETQAATKKLSTIFARRSSSKSIDDIKVTPRSVPGSSAPPPLTNSSQGSFSLHNADLVSPPSAGEGHNNTWISSPATENDEIAFSSGEASHWGPGMRPWLDATNHHPSSRSSVISTLDTLPEQDQMLSVPEQSGPVKAPAKVKEGRVRSWSDTPLPQQRQPETLDPRPYSPAMSPSSPAMPKTPIRPKLGARTNSGNSVILGRMKSVFSRSGSRSRSNSLLKQTNDDVDEFGGISSQKMRLSISSSSMRSSGPVLDRERTVTTEDDNLPADGRKDSTERQSGTFKTPSLSSNASSTRQSVQLDPLQSKSSGRRTRLRASTVSLAPTSYHFGPPSPVPFPSVATPPRRQGTIRRLSNGLFGSGSSSPQHSTPLFPLPPRSSGSTSSLVAGMPGSGSAWEDGSVGMLSPGTSPRPSTGSLVNKSNALKQASVIRDGEETPREWLERAMATVGRGELASVLASSGDDFHMEALQLFMTTFQFTHTALDVALRKLLMHMSLPKETQQIDRVMEAFAKQYESCEPGLFVEKDNAYVLAFSMMMLHTDAFNKNNKNKMTKADYVRNSRMEGVPPFVLEAFFDNITFTPFVFIEDDADLSKSPASGRVTPSLFGPSTPTFSTLSAKSTKVDVYDLIVRDKLDSLRVNVASSIPSENPFSCLGTRPILDFEGLGGTFASAHSLLIPSPQRKNTGKMVTPGSKQAKAAEEISMSLRVTKVGLISRKDEGGDSKKSRKWKSWSVVLTQSQLLFFKDPLWALTLTEQMRTSSNLDRNGHLNLPHMTTFKPDEVFPVKDCIAVFDRGNHGNPNTFRFIISQTQQYLMQAPDEFELNEWVTLINYASAFKTAGIKMRGGTMRKDQAVLAGAAAAASHRRDLRGSQRHGPSVRNGGAASGKKAVFGEPNAARSDLNHMSSENEVRGVDVTGANERLQEGEQLEEVFGVVKAELAAGRGEAKASSFGSKVASDRTYSHASRLAVIQNNLRTFREKEALLESSIRSSLLLARNIHTLTPFQKSTRDRLASFIPPLARRVRTERLSLSKYRLWISVLEREAERAEEEWKEVRHVALQAAAQSLRENGVRGVVKAVSKNDGECGQVVPHLELPQVGKDTDDEDDGIRLGSSPGELPVMFRRPSDDVDRARSTTSRETTMSLTATHPVDEDRRRTVSSDFWLSPNDLERRSSDVDDLPATRVGTPDAAVVGSPSKADDMKGSDVSGTNTPMMFIMESPMDIGDEDKDKNKFFKLQQHAIQRQQAAVKSSGQYPGMSVSKEEAEDWEKTKAARRVSLVRPGDMSDWESLRKSSGGSKV